MRRRRFSLTFSLTNQETCQVIYKPFRDPRHIRSSHSIRRGNSHIVVEFYWWSRCCRMSADIAGSQPLEFDGTCAEFSSGWQIYRMLNLEVESLSCYILDLRRRKDRKREGLSSSKDDRRIVAGRRTASNILLESASGSFKTSRHHALPHKSNPCFLCSANRDIRG